LYSTHNCTVHTIAQYIQLHSTHNCTVHTIAQYIQLHSTHNCTVHTIAQYIQLHSTHNCTVHTIAQYTQLHSTYNLPYTNHNNCNNYTCISIKIHCLNRDYQVSTAWNKTKMWTLNMASHMTSYCAHTSQEPFLSHSSELQHHTQNKFHCNHRNLCCEHDNKCSGSTHCREFLGQLRHISCARQLLHCVTAKPNSAVNVFMMFSAATETALSFL